jgi:hypothetical protein
MAVFDELVRELKLLRKGRGLLVGRVERVGLSLRKVCGVVATDTAADIRRKVGERIAFLVNNLPADLQLAVTAAFGIHPDARQPFYKDRIQWAAEQLGRDERTVRRRVDVGIEALAELAASGTSVTADLVEVLPRWHTSGLWVTLSLDLPTPEVFEYRRIIADQDGVEELDLSLTLASAHMPDFTSFRELDIDVFRGGNLVRRSRESSDRFTFALALPRRLGRGQTHDYIIRCRVPSGRVMQPHYLCIPKHRCELFDLNVRFAKGDSPQNVWRLREAFQRDVDDPLPHGDALPVDSAGEVHLSFRELTPGLAYGVRW